VACSIAYCCSVSSSVICNISERSDRAVDVGAKQNLSFHCAEAAAMSLHARYQQSNRSQSSSIKACSESCLWQQCAACHTWFATQMAAISLYHCCATTRLVLQVVFSQPGRLFSNEDRHCSLVKPSGLCGFLTLHLCLFFTMQHVLCSALVPTPVG
jgi:hypothetical protein